MILLSGILLSSRARALPRPLPLVRPLPLIQPLKLLQGSMLRLKLMPYNSTLKLARKQVSLTQIDCNAEAAII